MAVEVSRTQIEDQIGEEVLAATGPSRDRSASPGTYPDLSVVVPTRNEAGNIAALVERLEAAITDRDFEVIFVDDSDDGTVAAIETVRSEARCQVILLHRPPGQRNGGLGSAVVMGLRIARAPWVCVMDADLQHPPELVPQLLARAHETSANLVVASRYSNNGTRGNFSRLRSSLSQASTNAAKTMFPVRLRNISDPMSGFFLVRKAILNLDELQPRGFKILLEILVRANALKTAEVGFRFGERYAGESKASLKEGLRYLGHLGQLRFSPQSLRFIGFLVIGVSGLVVNTLVLAGATELLGLFYLLSVVLATQGSTLWNFVLTERLFSDRHQKEGRFSRLAMFYAMNNAALALRGPMIYLLTSYLGMNYLISNIVSLLAIMVVRYNFADKLIWRGRAKKEYTRVFNYNIHDIVTVVSDAWLPELERFLSQTEIEKPTIRVRIGRIPLSRRRVTESVSGNVRRIKYVEVFGSLGFGMDVTMGETIEVVASPILRRSPHVLYTNIVEPILRWTFVEKGYALVHGACMAFGDKAYMVTARTDTGKTTTMLRILAQQRRAADIGGFLSDDLTLVSPDGRVFTYPKPMTISYHTVRAINAARLTRREQIALTIQSRVHSKSGRRFAFLLTSTRLPVATINTIVQLLVPPPKYHVQRLVPSVKVVQDAKLAGLFIIERGGEGDVALDHQEALDILMSNCEDAYGFPPYPAIKSFLHGSTERDLQAAEREIVTRAFGGCTQTLLRSTNMDWAQRIATAVNVNFDLGRDDRPAMAHPAEGAVSMAAATS